MGTLTNDIRMLLAERYSPADMQRFQHAARERGDFNVFKFWQDRLNALKAPPPKAPEAPKAAVAPGAAAAPGTHAEGGKIKAALHGAWHAVSDPFKKAWQLATDKEYRTEVKDFVVRAAKKEGTQTKEMAKHIARAMKGEKLTKEEKAMVADQLADIVKASLITGVVAHAAAGGVAQFLATVASPVDELVGVALDGPLRKLTKKMLGREHGLLPTSFYEEGVTFTMLRLLEAKPYKEGDEYEVIQKLVDAVLDELSKSGISDDDIADALAAAGLHKKPGVLDKLKALFSK